MEKGLFFNAFPDDLYETGYDRNYSADDISNWLKVVITTGVIKTDNIAGTGDPQGLKVTAATGNLKLNINAGLAVIEGKPYINDSLYTLSLDTAPTGANPRYDMIVLRMDNSQTLNGRKTYFTVKSVNAIPTISDLTRDNNCYDLLVAYAVIQPNATTLQQTDIVDCRGDVDLCPWCTAVKGYEDYYDAIVQRFEDNITLTSSTQNVSTNLASSLYNTKYSLISVYVNGLKEEDSNYTIDTTNAQIVIRFTTTKTTNAQISVILENFLDGEGLSNVLADYTQFVNDVANLKVLNEFNYYCNGSTDNVEICNLVNAFLSKSGNYYQTLKLNVIGQFGYTAAMAGDGSSASPYRIFAFDKTYTGGRRVLIDFSNAYNLTFTPTAGKNTYIFSGVNICIKGATVLAINTYTAGTSVVAFEPLQNVRAENCRFWVYGYTNSYIAARGEFINCKGYVRNYGGDSFCFKSSSNVYLGIIGGEYTAHTAVRTDKSAVVSATVNSGITELQNVIAAKIDYTGLYQSGSIYHTAGYLSSFGLISTLAVVSGSGAQVIATISANPHSQLW